MSVLLLNKAWAERLENWHVGVLTGEDKELIFLASYATVQAGKACWANRWDAVTWGAGPEGTDERFVAGKMQAHKIKRVKQA